MNAAKYFFRRAAMAKRIAMSLFFFLMLAGSRPGPAEVIYYDPQGHVIDKQTYESLKKNRAAKAGITGETLFTVAEGVITDLRTGLQWFTGPDQATTVEQALAWVAGLKAAGGGWRMPTMSEVQGLYLSDVGQHNMDPAFKTTGWCVWSKETDADYTTLVNFSDRERGVNDFSRARAFAVRQGSR